MALIARYVKVDSNEVQIKESFLNFFPLHRKNADEIIIVYSRRASEKWFGHNDVQRSSIRQCFHHDWNPFWSTMQNKTN